MSHLALMFLSTLTKPSSSCATMRGAPGCASAEGGGEVSEDAVAVADWEEVEIESDVACDLDDLDLRRFLRSVTFGEAGTGEEGTLPLPLPQSCECENESGDKGERGMPGTCVGACSDARNWWLYGAAPCPWTCV